VLTYRSGLLGVSGVSSDLREVLRAADSGSERAQLAYDRFVRSIRGALGALVAVLGGVDAVVFTGGMGENSARLRRDVASAFAYAGVELAVDANGGSEADYDTSTAGSRVRVLVVHSREDLVILREVLRVQAR
jgi:acetate kinase